MARIRSVKPEFWEDQELAEQTSRDARLLYIGLWNLADEHGRLRGSPQFIHGRVFPYEDDLSVEDVIELLAELARAEKIVQYRAGTGGKYIYLPNLEKHQRLEGEKVASKLPDPYAEDSERLAPVAHTRNSPAVTNPGSAQAGANESAHGANESALSYGTGSMEHGAWECAPDEPARVTPDPLIQPDTTPRPTPSTAPKARAWTDKQILDDPNWIKFWDAYPLRKDRRKALRAWLNALKRGADPNILIEGARAYRDNPKRSPDYTAHPTTWLNGDRWDDEQIAAAPPRPEAKQTPWWEA